MLVLSSCIATGTRFNSEYDMDRPSAVTPTYKIRVVFPPWLLIFTERSSTLRMVDSYVDTMRHEYPWCKKFPFDKYTVFIHQSLDRCVSGPDGKGEVVWCHGWTSGHYNFICWGKKNGMVRDCFPSLPHEFFHRIFKKQYGFSDRNHTRLFCKKEIKNVIKHAKTKSDKITLSDETKQTALSYPYDPWNVPGYRED